MIGIRINGALKTASMMLVSLTLGMCSKSILAASEGEMMQRSMHTDVAASHQNMMQNADHNQADFKDFDRDMALRYSQAAIDRKVADYRFYDRSGRVVQLSDFNDTPLLISLIYTSCYHICPTTTQHLDRAVQQAREAMPGKEFKVLTIGFDTLRDTPGLMAEFARQQGVGDPDWHFLSSDKETIAALAEDLGFIFYPSPQGFNHLVQTSILNSEGRVYRQVYGMKFAIPQLIEPLKELLFNRPGASLVDQVSDKIRFFCTVYDAANDRYRFDYSIFIGAFIGIMCCAVLGLQLFREWRRTLSQS